MTTEQLTTAQENRDEYLFIENILQDLDKVRGVSLEYIEDGELHKPIFLAKNDKAFLKAVKKAIKKEAKRQLKQLDKEFDNI